MLKILASKDCETTNPDEIIKQLLTGKILFKNLAGTLKNNKKVILAAITFEERNFEYVDSNLKKDRSFVMACLKINGLCLQWLDDLFRDDKEIVLLAVQNKGEMIICASERLTNDFDIAKTAIENNIDAYNYLGKEIKKNKTLIQLYNDIKDDQFFLDEIKKNINQLETYIKNNIFLMNYLLFDGAGFPSAWRKKEIADCLTTNLSPKFLSEYKDIKKQLKTKFNIEFIHRFKEYSSLLHIIESRHLLEKKGPFHKKTCLFLSSKTDHNGVSWGQGLVEQIIKQGLQVIYYEIDSAKAFHQLIMQTLPNNRFEILILSAHGNKNLIELGINNNKSTKNNPKYLTNKDINSIKNHKLQIKNIILDCCLAAEKKYFNKNIAQAFKNIFYKSNIFASKSIIQKDIELIFDNDQLKDVLFSNNKKNQYKIIRR